MKNFLNTKKELDIKNFFVFGIRAILNLNPVWDTIAIRVSVVGICFVFLDLIPIIDAISVRVRHFWYFCEPNLSKAVAPKVPLFGMLNFHRFLAGSKARSLNDCQRSGIVLYFIHEKNNLFN